MLVHGTLYRQFSSGLRQIHQHLRPPRPLGLCITRVPYASWSRGQRAVMSDLEVGYSG